MFNGIHLNEKQTNKQNPIEIVFDMKTIKIVIKEKNIRIKLYVDRTSCESEMYL